MTSITLKSTAEVARIAGISEADVRDLADDIGVARIGNAFAWTEDDVQQLLERLDDESDDGDSDGDPDDDDGDDVDDNDQDDGDD